MGITIKGRALIPGEADGPLLVSDEPLSFWGGFDYKSGTVIDERHPLVGQSVVGKVLALPFTRGSSSTTAVLLEAAKKGTAPSAILTTAADPFFALASIVAHEMYGNTIPIVQLNGKDFTVLNSNQMASVTRDGLIKIN